MSTDGHLMAATVHQLFRYPVKSMHGEELTSAAVTAKGLAGDRAYAVVDDSDGTIATAKNPRKWGRLLEFQASFTREPDAAGTPPPVAIRFPDGVVRDSDDPDIDRLLTDALERPVHLARATGGARELEIVWADIEGLNPKERAEVTKIGMQGDEVLGRTAFGVMSPPDRYFDYSVLHLLTTATLRRLVELEPSATFDVRRYRPNVVLESSDEGFVENDWVGITLTANTLHARVLMQCMRCVMTTLPQGDLPLDRLTLRTIAAHNRLSVEGMGQWACAGVYGDVTQPGTLQVGDEMHLIPTPADIPAPTLPVLNAGQEHR